MESILDEKGRSVAQNFYDSNDRIIEQDAEGDFLQSWFYAFTGLRNVEVNPLGDTSVYLYDSKGRNTGFIDGVDNRSLMVYDGQGHLIQTTDPRGGVALFQYDGQGNLLCTTNANTNVTQYVYDSQNRLSHVIDATGKSTDFEYDAQHHLIKMIDATLRVSECHYKDGLLSSLVAPSGDTTTFLYDAYGQLKQTTRPDTSVAYSTFDARGDLTYSHLAASGDPNSHEQTYFYDRRRLLLGTKDGLSFGMTNVYDACGRLTSSTDRFGNTSSGVSSTWGRTQSSSAHNAAATQYHHDLAGRQDSVTNALGQVTQVGYDPAGRLTAQLDALMQFTSYSYDGAGNLTTLTNTRGKVWNWTFTPANQTSSRTFAGSNPSFYHYNSRELLESTTSPSGRNTILHYFDDGRPQDIIDELGTISFGYDPKGRLHTVTEGSAVIDREYNCLNQLSQFTDAAGNTLGYKYDGAGNLTELTYPDSKKVTYAYDAANRLDHVTDWENRVTQFKYDDHSRLTAILPPNGTKRGFSYDGAGRVNQIHDETIASASTISQFDLQYDALNRILKETVTPTPAPYVEAPASLTYGDDDSLATWNGQTCVSDLEGNLTTGPLNGSLTSFSFDARNRLASVGNTSYAYDAENRRVSKTVGGVTTRYVQDSQSALSRLLVATTGSATTSYVYAGGMLLYEETGTFTKTYHFDSRGSTVALTDDSGIVTDRIAYNDYGAIVQRTGTTATPFLFNGSCGVQTDANGLYYMRARYYNPDTRRWLSRDPIGENGGLNLYAYVGNHPINSIDPFGLKDDGFPALPFGGRPIDAFFQPLLTEPPAPTTDPGNAHDYGSQWLDGTAPSAILGQNSQWTHDMQNSRVVNIDRNRMSAKLRDSICSSSKNISVPLGGELGGQPDSIPIAIYPFYFIWDFEFAPTEAFIGSWTEGNITAQDVNYSLRTATVHFHAVNVSGWTSGTHYPPLFGHYGGSLLHDNVFGEDGYGHNVSQTFDWDEEISF